MVNVETLSDLFVFELQGVSYLESRLAAVLETLTTQSKVDSLDDALRNPFYLDVNPSVVERLETNREDATEALREARNLDGGSAATSLYDRLAEQTPMD